jgi:hypothetical protein
MPAGDKIPQPLGSERIDLVVVGGHSPVSRCGRNGERETCRAGATVLQIVLLGTLCQFFGPMGGKACRRGPMLFAQRVPPHFNGTTTENPQGIFQPYGGATGRFCTGL